MTRTSELRERGRALGEFTVRGIIPFVVFAFILGLVSAWAQIDTGAVLGTVTDKSGARVPGATVGLRNEGTNFTQTVTTGQDGTYVFSPIHIGTYTVTVTASGFQKQVLEHLEVAVQQHRVADVTLQPGTVNTTIAVTSTIAALQTQDASLGQVIEHHDVVALPLNGRNYVLLAQLSAGVTTTQSDSRNLVLSGSFISNGVQTIYNNYLLDGIDNNNNEVDYLNGAAYVVRPPVDAIEEFKVETNNFSAEFGRSAGAVLNAVTKSGTNQFHGNAWEYLRNQAMDATDFFVNLAGQTKGRYQRNQFGFTLGGPVYIPRVYNGVNKTFFFFDYEGMRINQALPFYSSVPTALERSSGFTNFQDLITYQTGTQKDLLGRTSPLGTVFDPATTRAATQNVVDATTGLTATGNGFVRDPFANNTVPATRVDPVAVKLLDLYPAPIAVGIVNNYFSEPIKTDNDTQYDVRVDHYFGSRDQSFVRVSHNFEPVFLPTPLPGLAEGDQNFNVGNQTTSISGVALSETHTFSPATLNEFRVGYKRIQTIRLQPYYSVGVNLAAQYGIAGIPYLPPGGGGLPEFSISGLALLGGHNSLPSNEINSEAQILDNVSKQLKSHSLRFGMEYDRMKVAVIQPGWPWGYFAYNGSYTDVPNGSTASTGIAQFSILPGASSVAGGVANLGAANQVEVSDVWQNDFRHPAYAAYIQDNWRVTPKLTVNLGVRWEAFPMLTDNFGGLANFLPGTAQYIIDDRSKNITLSPSFLSNLATDGISLSYSANHALETVSPWNFGPRIGFAYQVAQKLVIRAAYGMFYDGIFDIGQADLGTTYPFSWTLNYTPANSSSPITPNNSIGLTSNGLSNVPVSPASLNANGLGLSGQQYNWTIPYVESSNFSIQYLLSKDASLTASFVTTGGRHLNSNDLSNKPTELLTPSSTITQYVPYPQFAVGPIEEMPAANSDYYGAQLTYTQRLASGFSVLGNYTWARARSDATDSLFLNSVSYRAPDVPGFGIHGDFGPANFDIRDTVHLSAVYALPFGKGRAFLNHGGVSNAIIGGWTLSGIFTYETGNPLSVSCSITTGASSGCNALMVPGVGLYAGMHTVQHWANVAAFANAPTVTAVGQSSFAPLGGTPFQIFGPPFHRGDFSLQKRWQTSEHTAIEFRGDFFNLTNTPNFGAPGSLSVNSATFGNITATRDTPNDPREVQLSLTLDF